MKTVPNGTIILALAVASWLLIALAASALFNLAGM